MLKEIQERRSIRKFETRKVSRDRIESVISAGIKAPSAKNRQPWKFIVVENPQEKEQICSAMAVGIRKEEEGKGILPNSKQHIADAKHSLNIIKDAPIVILVLNVQGVSLETEQTVEEKIYDICNIQSIGAAIENMLLEAEALGLGGLWICNTYFAYEELKQWLDMDGELIAAVALGYPAEKPAARPRKNIKDVCIWK